MEGSWHPNATCSKTRCFSSLTCWRNAFATALSSIFLSFNCCTLTSSCASLSSFFFIHFDAATLFFCFFLIYRRSTEHASFLHWRLSGSFKNVQQTITVKPVYWLWVILRLAKCITMDVSLTLLHCSMQGRKQRWLVNCWATPSLLSWRETALRDETKA